MARPTGVPGRRTLILACVLAALVALGPAAGSAGAVRLTFIGDSKAAGIEFSAPAKRLLARGHIVRRDLKVCRRLVAPSCAYKGVTPLTALQAVRRYGTSLGRVLVIDVGYNDSSATYRGQMIRVIKAAKARGVKGIVWVNLKAVRTNYRRINTIINQVASGRPIVRVANWNAYSRGKTSWFATWDTEKIHLTSAGAVGLVRLVRKHIPLAAQGAGAAAAREAPDPVEEPETAPAEEPTTTAGTETAEAELTASSPPVGPNLGGPGGGSTGLSGVLPFAGGAVLMLFLILVTVKRRRVA
ncbi:MAG TPA: hypothetical protein VD769_11915 [Gaiellaceae bacterium]|nr:hypothetical protein [Gaiellaceae bacterium]